MSLKYLSLVVLIVQNSALAILMRMSRLQTDEQFNTSTAVVTGEFLKLFTCVLLVIRDTSSSTSIDLHEGNKLKWWQVLVHTVSDYREFSRIGIPATLYLMQNNLQYISISNLDAASYQVLYQLKILTTAIFSVFILKKAISLVQWGAIVLLMVGVALVQLQSSSSSGQGTKESKNNLIGLISVLLACICSGFAGVYFEKILKNKASKQSVWQRNIQMSLISCVFGLLQLAYSHSEYLHTKGFFYGYRPIVWCAISVSAFGGLLTAVVVKYADNILKAFATSLAMVLTVIISIFLFQIIPSFQFILGAAFVNIAVYVYGNSPSWGKQNNFVDSTEGSNSSNIEVNVEKDPLVSDETIKIA